MVVQRIASVCALIVALVVGVPLPLYAATSPDFSVTPVIISEKAKARDIIKQSITVTNTSSRKLNLYPSVNDVNPDEGDQDFVKVEESSERAVSLSNWIELSRGVLELGPGEEKEIPFVIRVNLNAEPGLYHARIRFTEGSTRDSAEATESLGEVAVTIEVTPDVKEVLQLNKFFTDNIFLAGDDVLFSYNVENIGNQDLKPTGEIRIYNRKGEEVAAVPVNSDGRTFSPEQSAQLASVWSGATGFGKYKAFLNIDYGSTQRASVQDTVFFWIVPWKQLFALFTVSVLLIIFLVFYYHQRLERRYAFAAVPSEPHTPRPVPHSSPAPQKIKKRLSFFPRPQKQWKVAAEWPNDATVSAPHAIHETPRVAPKPLVSPLPPASEESPVAHHPTIIPVAPISPAPAPQGDTIDLRELCKKPATPSVHHEIHVINLKR